jgi:DNA repair protein RecO (recombination protein O)
MATSKPGSPLLAYVLHRYDWSETSLIVELFTRAQGRVVVVAKGAKRPTSQLRPVLLPFQPLHALLGKTPADASNELHLLRSAEWAGGQPLLAAAAMFSGFYLNELLLKLLARQDPHPALFDAYADTLAALAATGGSTAAAAEEAVALRAFDLLLLRELGLLPELSQVTLTAENLQAGQHYALHSEAGLAPAMSGISGAAWIAIEAALAHGSMDALRAACTEHAAPLREPLRKLLHYHLGHTPLRTRQIWQGVQRLARIPTDT